MAARMLRLGLSIRGHGYHPAAWRHPDVPADGTHVGALRARRADRQAWWLDAESSPTAPASAR